MSTINNAVGSWALFLPSLLPSSSSFVLHFFFTIELNSISEALAVMDAPPRTNISFIPAVLLSFTSPLYVTFQSIIVCGYFHFFPTEVRSNSTAPPQTSTILSTAIPNLLNFLVLKYQSQDKSPFQTHPKTLLFGVISFLLCYLVADHRQTSRHSSNSSMAATALCWCGEFLGNMCLAALTSLLVPDSATPAVYAMFAIISSARALTSYLSRYMTGIPFQRTRLRDSTHIQSPFGTWRSMEHRNVRWRSSVLPL